MALNNGIIFTWLGHGTFRVKTPGGKNILIDPWLEGNPACPAGQKHQENIDIMLITHGHFDHIGDALPVARENRPKVVGIFELCSWLQNKGVENTSPMNKGGTQQVEDIKVTMVHADHSCGILDDGKIIYGGEAVGYVIEFENGFKVYHAGDTNVFGDMKLIAELYKPELALLPIGDHFTMGPRESAFACKLLQPKTVIPMDYATFPLLTGTPELLEEQVKGTNIEIVHLKPGESYS